MSFAGARRAHARRVRGRLILAVASLALLSACAMEVGRRPTKLVPVEPSETVEIQQDAPVSVGPGYRRVIPTGSRWARVGRTPEGHVYKPIDRVFTVEGAQIHEAYLVLDDQNRIVGFYLPVERAFSAAPGGTETTLSVRRKAQ